MFRLAVISDVHADVHALLDALRQIDAMKCDGVVCCGDVVDYGVFPDETIAELICRKIPTVRGNHDRWAIERRAARGGGWDLSNESKSWLRGLPTSIRIEQEGIRIAIHHASPRGDIDGIDPRGLDAELARTYLREADTDVLIVGHTHVSFAFEVEGGGLIVNPGALLREAGQGAGGPPATGMFGVLEVAGRSLEVFRAFGGSFVARSLSGEFEV